MAVSNLPPQVEQMTQKVDAFMAKYPKITMQGKVAGSFFSRFRTIAT